MDFNSNRTSNPHTKAKHIPRLQKEMYEHRLRHNPFSSPPSSTGSNDTVSTTTEELSRNLSNFSFSPDGEGTRRFSDEYQPPKRAARSGRFGTRPTTEVNTSAIARAYPEWSGLAPKDGNTISQTVQTVDIALPFNPIPSVEDGKENIPPADETADNTFENALDFKRKRARADMQARVDDGSECSTVLSHVADRPLLGGARRTRFSSAPAEIPGSSPPPVKQSLQDMVSKIRSEKQAAEAHMNTPPRQSPLPRSSLQPPAADRTGVSPTSRSFFLPTFRHLPDWTAGALRFSSIKNGTPVFTRAGVKLNQSNEHRMVNSAQIPEEDEEIFVSLDKLQEEVRELHDHDAMLQREAEKLQREVNMLQYELKMFKTRKRSDSALGSESDGSFRRGDGHDHELEAQIAQLQDRLDQASRQVGVHDIHSSALAAERDEALYQASVARERAMKLQAELEATQKDLESTLQYRHEKETLRLENTSLAAANETLKQQHDAAVENSKNLSIQCEKLRRDLAVSQKDLAAAREELASVRRQNEALLEEKRILAQDHASMERSNETYFKENKKLQAQIAARDQHIADLQKGISTRDEMIDKINSLTTDTAVLELNAELEAELERVKAQLQQQSTNFQEKDGSISAKEGRIRVLKEQNHELSAENQKLAEQMKQLRDEYEQIKGYWIDDRHKVVRLNQQLTKNNTEYLRTLNDNTEDCVRLEEDFKVKEATLRQKLERREAAIKKVKQLTTKIVEIAQQDITGKTVKVTRIVEPTGSRYAASDLTGRSSAMNVDDDPTTELHLTQGSDFVSIMDNEVAKLKQTYRDIQEQQQQGVEAGNLGDTVEISEYDLPVLPDAKRRQSDASIKLGKAVGPAQPKAQPAGILKKSSQFPLEDDTGRFSVKSALSIASHHSDDESVHSVATNRSHRSVKSNSNTEKIARPESRLRRNSETGQVGADATVTEQNMTSAFFMPDITIDTEKDATKEAVPSLSKEARRVLDSICQHKSGNCNVCIRIAAHGEKRTTKSSRISLSPEEMRKGKKTVSVEKPVPVSERVTEREARYVEEPTMRPSMEPGKALAILIKETQDEIDHLQLELKRMNEVYFGLDKSLGQRERRRVMAEIKKLQSELEMKSGHLYKLHDVLEGQKQAGQLMGEDEVNVTVLSGLVRLDATTVESKDGSWNGFD
ncbi:protein Daple [Echria macrotheca]|uniref:Protein Daple n=1 Tax=Echria macrotheca TaxID=438768 RepID=A0AAJ0BDI6_9PEZI|nr:protein Daple [Echria macrotheca]